MRISDSATTPALEDGASPLPPATGGFLTLPLRNNRDRWNVDTQLAIAARAAFVITVLYAGFTFWLAPYPPMADLPQHAGQVALLRDLLLGQSAWGHLLWINYFTPYLIGYELTLALSFLMPVADAMKLLLTLGFYGFVFGCVLLRKHFHGDERLDWLYIPGFFGFAYAWGFFSYLLAAPLGLLFILMADRYAERPTVTNGLRVCAMGLILFFAHGLVFLFACWIGLALLLARPERRARAWKGLLPYIPLGVLSVVYAAISFDQEPALPNGSAAVIWREWELRLNLISHIFRSTPYDQNDAIFISIAGVLMLWAPRLLKSSLNRARYQAIIPMAVLALVWIAAPYYALKTTFIYTRFALFALPFYALMFCRPARLNSNSAAEALQVQVGQWLLAAVCWVLLAGQTDRLVAFARESRDFDVVRLAVEPRHRALALILDNDSPAARSHLAYHHHPVWYQAENGGLVDFNFAWYPSQIVRFRDDQLPSIRPFWRPEDFSWTEHKGWLYRYFFIRHTQPVPETFFRNSQCEVALLKSAGSWSVYESKQCRQ